MTHATCELVPFLTRRAMFRPLSPGHHIECHVNVKVSAWLERLASFRPWELSSTRTAVPAAAASWYKMFSPLGELVGKTSRTHCAPAFLPSRFQAGGITWCSFQSSLRPASLCRRAQTLFLPGFAYCTYRQANSYREATPCSQSCEFTIHEIAKSC